MTCNYVQVSGQIYLLTYERKKMKTALFVMTFISALILVSCDNDDKTGNGVVRDIDGNIYQTVTIGSQTWMAENLKTTRYRNGDSVKYTTDIVTGKQIGRAHV